MKTYFKTKVLKKKKIKKPKAKSVTSLKKRLDALFSKWIRMRDTKDGLCECFTCGAKKPPEKMQNGHFFSRSHLSLRWDARNCHAQDYACNIMKHGDMATYATKMVRMYGPEILEEFDKKKREVFLPPEGLRAWLVSRIEFYKKALESLTS